MKEIDRIIKPEDLIEGNVPSTLGGPPQKPYYDNFRGARNLLEKLMTQRDARKKK